MKHLKWIAPILALTLFVTIIRPDNASDFASASVVSVKEIDTLTSLQTLVPKNPPNEDALSSRAFGLLAEANKLDLSSVELPRSLRGTKVDGGFRVDKQGNLIVELGIKRYFDYFMATVGEVSLAEITARIYNAISTQLQEPARSQALIILEGYLSYKAALFELEREYGGETGLSIERNQLPALARRLEAMIDLRRTHFSGDVAEVFFSGEEAVDIYTLKKLNVLHSGGLSQEDKANQIAELDRLLPEGVKQQKEEAAQYQRYSMAESKLRNKGALASEIHQLRVKTFGQEGAASLAELDAKRAAWEYRLAQYRVEQRQLQSSGLSPQDAAQQVSELRRQHFSVLEVRRVNALDRMNKY